MTEPNPLLQIRFEVPFDQIRPEHVRPAIRTLLEQAGAGVRAIGEAEAPPTYENTLKALEDVLEPLGWAIGLVGHLESVATTPELREAYNEVQPEVAAFFSGLPLDPRLWRAIKAVAESEEARGLDSLRRRHLDKTVDDFRRAGADLDETGKQRLQELDVELARATNAFSQNLLDATAAWELVVEDEARLGGLPDHARAAARESARAKGKEGWRFTLQHPSVVPVLTYLHDAGIRETVWRAYNRRASEGEKDNRPLIDRILRLRREKAALLGFASYPDLVLADRMARTGETARAFVRELADRTRAFFDAENEALAAFRRAEGDAGEMQPWDVGYWAERRRRALYDYDEEALRPFFPEEAVLDGLFSTVRRLYGVEVRPRDELPAWDPAVRTFGLYDGAKLLGAFYVDPFPREAKRGGAWMNDLYTGGPKGDRFDPHLGLVCANLTPPAGDEPALLLHGEVETLFHEFGHLMHQLLSTVPVKSLAATHVAWDFVELPSQIMENWCWEREALDLFARHHRTGEPIPRDLFDKMVRARNYRAANAMMRQLGFAELDLALHTDYDPESGEDPVTFSRRILQAHTPARLPDDYVFVTTFGHLFAHPVGYGAGYYSYKWAEVLDADAFSRFQEAGVFDPEVGRAFREQILARGDSAEPMALFRAFMGREPRMEALLERSGLVEGAPPTA